MKKSELKDLIKECLNEEYRSPEDLAGDVAIIVDELAEVANNANRKFEFHQQRSFHSLSIVYQPSRFSAEKRRD